MAQFGEAFYFVLKREGALADLEGDRGGITKWGISQRFLKMLLPEKLQKYGVVGDPKDPETIKNLTQQIAMDIYQGEFWYPGACDKIVDNLVADYYLDMLINMGQKEAVRCLQMATHPFGDNYGKIVLDGIIGKKTLDAVNRTGEKIMPALMTARANYYWQLLLKFPELSKFLKGWLNRTYQI